MFSVDKTTYTQIHIAAHKIAKKYGIDDQTAEDITQEVAIILFKTLKDEAKSGTIKNLMAYTRDIVKNKFADYYRDKKKKTFDVKDIDWMTDTFDMSLDTLIDNQASHPHPVDEYIRRYPKSLSRQNHKLWQIFKQQENFSVPEIMKQMGMKNPSTYYTAKARLLARLIDINEKINQGN